MNNLATKKFQQTAAARAARWQFNTSQDEKNDAIVLFIARIGWATVEIVNYYFAQSSQTWPSDLERDNLIFREKIAVKNAKKSRTKSNATVMTILLLSEKGQRRARKLDGRIGKRICPPSSKNARHDLITIWVSCYLILEQFHLMQQKYELEIWSDPVLRSLITSSTFRPDAKICAPCEWNIDGEDAQEENSHLNPLIEIEVERSKKKTGLEEFIFLKKLEFFTQKEREIMIIVETIARLQSVIELLERGEKTGLTDFYYNKTTKIWWPQNYSDPKIFFVRATVCLWDQNEKKMTQAHFHNIEFLNG